MSGPLTLAEFNKRLDQMVLYDGGGEAQHLPDTLGDLILRLLAGERARCAQACKEQAAMFAKDGIPRSPPHAAISCATAVRALGDPTP